jgi:putative ABC transport system permease protein
MKIILTLAWRNLWRNKRRSLITISSVLFAVLLAIVFYSMEQGSYGRMIDSMVKYSTGYIQIQDVFYEDEPSIDNSLLYDDELAGLLRGFDDRIAYQVPRLQNFALVATEGQTRGSMVVGIDPEKEQKLNDLSDNLTEGELIKNEDSDILVAEGLAGILNVHTGDTLVLIGQGFQGATAAGKYRIKGIIDLKLPELNNNMIYMSLQAAQWFYMAEDRLTALIVMPENPKETDLLIEELNAAIDQEWYRVLGWEQMLEDLLALMSFDMAGTMVMLFILYIVIAFGLFGTILTMIIERQREFGMLLSLGMKRGQLALMCFFETLFISFAGALAGIALAIPVVLWFYYNPIPLTGEMAEAMLDYGFEPIMPFAFDPYIFVSQARIVLIISVFIGLYPVYKMFRLNIMHAKQ